MLGQARQSYGLRRNSNNFEKGSRYERVPSTKKGRRLNQTGAAATNDGEFRRLIGVL